VTIRRINSVSRINTEKQLLFLSLAKNESSRMRIGVGDEISEDEIVGACSTDGRDDKCKQYIG
jgi:hypothetical protein